MRWNTECGDKIQLKYNTRMQETNETRTESGTYAKYDYANLRFPKLVQDRFYTRRNFLHSGSSESSSEIFRFSVSVPFAERITDCRWSLLRGIVSHDVHELTNLYDSLSGCESWEIFPLNYRKHPIYLDPQPTHKIYVRDGVAVISFEQAANLIVDVKSCCIDRGARLFSLAIMGMKQIGNLAHNLANRRKRRR